jgi:methyl-accepting chemotaxis protein
MKIGSKLILIGSLVLALPLTGLAYVAVTRAGAGLNALATEQLLREAKDLAQLIDAVYGGEVKLAQSLGNNPAITAVLGARAQKGQAHAAAEMSAAAAQMAPFMDTMTYGTAYEALSLTGEDGVVFLSTDAKAVGEDLSFSDYFKAATAGWPSVGAVMPSTLTGKPLTPIAVPVRVGGKTLGVLVLMVMLDQASAMIVNDRIGKGGYAFAVDFTGHVVAHPVTVDALKLNINAIVGMSDLAKEMEAGKTGVTNFQLDGATYTAGYAPVARTGWSVAFTLPESEYLASANDIRNAVVLFGAAGLVVAFFILLLFSRTITRPLERAVQFAQGDRKSVV